MVYFRKRSYGRKKWNPYRSAKKLIRKTTGLSLLEIGSRARIEPPWKRRKYQVISSQNDEDPTVSNNRIQSGDAIVTALSSTRFKPQTSDIFDYHHFTRRVRLADVSTVAGVANSVVHNAWTLRLADLNDKAAIQSLYGRYRFVRLVFEWVPGYDGAWPMQGGVPPLMYRRIFRGGGDNAINTEVKALDDPKVEVSTVDEKWAISMTPSCTSENVMVDDEPQYVQNPQPMFSPWLDTAKDDWLHYGCETLLLQRGFAFANVIYCGTMYVNVYFDCDSQGMA